MSLPPDMPVEKTFYIEANSAYPRGSGFFGAVDASLDIFRPYSADDMPEVAEMVERKKKLADRRWFDDGKNAGYLMHLPYLGRRDAVLGWCGQATAPAYALQVISKKDEDAKMRERVAKSLDLLCSAPFDERGFLLDFDFDTGEWGKRSKSGDYVSQAQAMLNIARAVRRAKISGGFKTSEWKNFCAALAICIPPAFSTEHGDLHRQTRHS